MQTPYVLFLHSKAFLINLEKKRSNGYSVPTSFSLISLSISFFPRCNNNNNNSGGGRSTAMLCFARCFFLCKCVEVSHISVASEIRDSLAASTVSQRLTERINVLLCVTITPSLRYLPRRPVEKSKKSTQAGADRVS